VRAESEYNTKCPKSKRNAGGFCSDLEEDARGVEFRDAGGEDLGVRERLLSFEVHVHVCACMCVYMCIYIYICVCVCVCVPISYRTSGAITDNSVQLAIHKHHNHRVPAPLRAPPGRQRRSPCRRTPPWLAARAPPWKEWSQKNTLRMVWQILCVGEACVRQDKDTKHNPSIPRTGGWRRGRPGGAWPCPWRRWRPPAPPWACAPRKTPRRSRTSPVGGRGEDDVCPSNHPSPSTHAHTQTPDRKRDQTKPNTRLALARSLRLSWRDSSTRRRTGLP
jgi:hypothetical protein